MNAVKNEVKKLMKELRIPKQDINNFGDPRSKQTWEDALKEYNTIKELNAYPIPHENKPQLNTDTVEIKVDNTVDPPKVVEDDLKKVPINMKDFAFSFRIETEDGNNRVAEILRDDKIRARLNRNPKGVLTGFFNKLLKRMAYPTNLPTKIVLTFTPIVDEAASLPHQKDGPTYNCVLDIIRKHGHLSIKKKGILDELNNDYFDKGVDEYGIHDISDQLDVNLMVFTILGGVWIESIKDSKYKTFRY